VPIQQQLQNFGQDEDNASFSGVLFGDERCTARQGDASNASTLTREHLCQLCLRCQHTDIACEASCSHSHTLIKHNARKLPASPGAPPPSLFTLCHCHRFTCVMNSLKCIFPSFTFPWNSKLVVFSSEPADGNLALPLSPPLICLLLRAGRIACRLRGRRFLHLAGRKQAGQAPGLKRRAEAPTPSIRQQLQQHGNHGKPPLSSASSMC